MKYVIEPYPELDTTLALIGSLLRLESCSITVLYRKPKDMEYLTDWIEYDLPGTLEAGRISFVPHADFRVDPKSDVLIEPEKVPDYKTLEQMLARQKK